MTAVVVPAIPSVTLPDGVYYTQRPVFGTCSSCYNQSIAYIEWVVHESGDTDVRGTWSCAEEFSTNLHTVMGHMYRVPGTDVTVELDNRWLSLAGVGALPTFVRRAS